jgi:hypothetical protein
MMKTSYSDIESQPQHAQSICVPKNDEILSKDIENKEIEKKSSIDTFNDGNIQETTETDEYPKGMNLFLIITALTLSIFLPCLDMVCGSPL